MVCTSDAAVSPGTLHVSATALPMARANLFAASNSVADDATNRVCRGLRTDGTSALVTNRIRSSTAVWTSSCCACVCVLYVCVCEREIHRNGKCSVQKKEMDTVSKHTQTHTHITHLYTLHHLA